MSSLLPLMLDIRHWLDDSGHPVPQIRRRVLHFARLIEYGGPLRSKQMRETLIECPRRPGRVPCPGLLWVAKTPEDTIEVFCLACEHKHATITGWQETEWAEGPMEPTDSSPLPSAGAPRDLRN